MCSKYSQNFLVFHYLYRLQNTNTLKTKDISSVFDKVLLVLKTGYPTSTYLGSLGGGRRNTSETNLLNLSLTPRVNPDIDPQEHQRPLPTYD